jgi:signal transduction histidine kinase
MKLATRFFLSHGSAAALTALGSFLLLYGGASAMLEHEAARRQAGQLQAFVFAAHEARVNHQDLGLLSFMRQASHEEGLRYLVYIEPSRNLRLAAPSSAALDAALAGPPPAGPGWRPCAMTLADGSCVLDMSMAADGALLRVGWSQQALQQAHDQVLRRWMSLAALAGLGALLLGALVSYLLAGRLIKPLRQISAGTHAVRAGSLTSLVEVKRGDEIGELARDFNAMVQQLKELDEMKRDFVSGVTHDLGTPLLAIRDGIHYLQTGQAGPLTEKQAEYLLLLSNSGQRLSTFINDLLSVARIEAGKVQPFYEAFDAAAELGELVKLYRPVAEQRGLKLSWVCQALDPTAWGDVVQFREMVINLLSNALKFTASGGLELELTAEERFLCLRVSDTGIGIAPEHHAQVFEKFYRVHQAEGGPARQGSGLGLAIVKGQIEAQGGSVSLESQLGQGATFTLRIPRRSSDKGGAA